MLQINQTTPSEQPPIPVLPHFPVGGHDDGHPQQTDPQLPSDEAALSSGPIIGLPDLQSPGPHLNTMDLDDFAPENLDILYYGALNFGTPVQSLTVDIDTGSADLWIPANCRSCNTPQFNPSRSSTFQGSDDEFVVTYGVGKAVGKLAQDVVSIGNLKVQKQDFGIVHAESEQFTQEPNSGIMGLAFSTIAFSKKPTFFENLLSSGQLQEPIFSVHLARGAQDGSQVCFGCYDKKKTTGPVNWLSVVTKTYWSVSMEGISSGLESENKTTATDLSAVIDTGTTLIYLPDEVAAQFYGTIPGARDAAAEYGEGFYVYPCTSTLSVSLSFSGTNFTINSSDFNIGRVSEGSEDCVGGILGLGDGFPSDLAIIGDEFLKSWYSTYDYGNGRVGLSPSINNSS
ncbi:aspartic peptidase domain-containing protein [Abortiporus biennis]|nr:aspartic peptidase domain-containing protein [Abortiporus biennis]